MKKLTKTQLINEIASRTRLTKKQASEVFDALIEEVVSSLKQGKTVGLSGLGTLTVTPTRERQGVRPGTTERITIPAGKKITFKVTSTFKDSL